MIKQLSLLLIFSFSFLNAINSQSTHDSLSMELDKIMNKSTLTGMAVAIYNEEGVFYQHAAGYVNIDQKIPYSTSHIQNIGSISKTYIAAALMKAVEAGKIDLDTDINDYLDFKVINPHASDKVITVRHLATHTSGIKDSKYYGKAYYLTEDISDWTKEQKNIKKIGLKKLVKHKNLSLTNYLKAYLIKGGEYYSKKNFIKDGSTAKYRYSNVAASLLGEVIGAAVGEDFNTYSTRVVLRELGLDNSGWMLEDVDMANHAVLYGPEDKALPKYALTTYPDGGMITSLDELAKFAIEMLKGYNGHSDYLSAKSFQHMMTSQWSRPEFRNTVTDDEVVGIIWELEENGAYVGHNGSDPGTFSFLRFFPEKNIGYVFLINCGIDEESSRFQTISDMFTHIAVYGKRMNVE